MRMKDAVSISVAQAGIRLDVFLARQYPEFSRSHMQKLIVEGAVLVNGRIHKPNYKLGVMDTIEFQPPEPQELSILPENIPLDILYEDEDIVVLNKIRGMVVHPAAGIYTGTLVNALLYHCNDLSGINGIIRPGIVHRLDKDTSGVMIVAKNDEAHVNLAEQIRLKVANRIYWAIVCGNVEEDHGIIRAAIGRHPTERKKMAVVRNGGKESTTLFRVLERFGSYTLVECRLKTGRTHQIRVHMAYIGHPLLGDPKYGKKDYCDIGGQALHSYELEFVHPCIGEKMRFKAELPEDMKKILFKLRKKADRKYK